MFFLKKSCHLMFPYPACVRLLNANQICHRVQCHIVKVSKSCQKAVNSCQKVAKSCKMLTKTCQKVVKKVAKKSETGRRRRRRRRRRRIAAPRPGTTLSHLVKTETSCLQIMHEIGRRIRHV
jgi:hypothetical protein